MKTLKVVVIQAVCLILAATCLLAQGGSIVVNTSVTAVAGPSGSSQISCIFSNPQRPTVHTVCSMNGTIVTTQDSTPAIGAQTGVTGSFNSIVGTTPNAITWIIQQPTAGTVTWTITVNGQSQSGTF